MPTSHRSYALRSALKADLAFVTALHHDTMREYIEPVWGWQQERWDRFVENWFDPGRAKIIQKDAIDVGILVTDEQSSLVYLESLSIVRPYQGQGLGTQVIQDLILAASAQCLPVVLDVLKTNVRARMLYERLGFKPCGESETSDRLKWAP